MTATYTIDTAHSHAQFTVRHMMISNVRGGFRNVTGTILYDPENPTASSVEAVIDVGSISTGDEQRDGHLKSADFLDAAHFPTITFNSTKVETAAPGELKLTGDVTIHGVKREVTLQLEGPTPEGKDPFGNIRIGLSASTKIKRSDFGLTFNAVLDTGGVLVGDDLKIEIDVEAIKKA